MELSNEEYLLTQQKIILFAQLVQDMPLAEFLDRISTAEAIGPMIDPTLYMKAQRNLDAIKDLAGALMKFKAAAVRLRAEAAAMEASKA